MNHFLTVGVSLLLAITSQTLESSSYVVQSCYYYYPLCCHTLSRISVLGDTLEIEDGSMWAIEPSDQHKVNLWNFQDILVVTQNFEWFSSYRYKLENRTLGTSVGVNLVQGPFLNNPNSRFVALLDYDRREVLLTDSSCFIISSKDTEMFRKWLLNDCIIIGSNTGWDSDYESLLLNTNMNQSIRAKQI